MRSSTPRCVSGISSVQRRRHSGPSSSMKKVRNAMMTEPKTVVATPLTAVRADPACRSRGGAAHTLDDLVLALEEAERAVALREVVDEVGQGVDQLRDLVDERRDEHSAQQGENHQGHDVDLADVALAGHALAYVVIANRRFTDLFE